MPEQLTFDLPVRTASAREDFFVSSANEIAVARLDDTVHWNLGKLALIGPAGSGKTHLLHVWAEAENALVITPDELQTLDIAAVDQPVAFDIGGATALLSDEAETALFHLHNHLAQRGHAFLVAARTSPARWSVRLPDLKSRLEAMDVTRIEAPDDLLLSAVYVKLFTDRQLKIQPDLIPWLLKNNDRSFDSAQSFVAALDAASLSENRAITKRFARQTLDKWSKDGR
ncbi:MAG: chromosomal replication initiator DnaA [Boseongicola sp.]|nr:chromosomal replication initiator DnaA [Boseongicola sp.]